jgi:hypothetical protein
VLDRSGTDSARPRDNIIKRLLSLDRNRKSKLKSQLEIPLDVPPIMDIALASTSWFGIACNEFSRSVLI